jgi:aminopeptidase N
LLDRFGPLEIPEINVLFRRWKQDGGVSNQGFVVFNIDETNAKMIRDIGPMIFNKNRREYFLHELAHQWWGGQISWSSYRDEWITEGFATLATILYLREKVSADRYGSLLQQIKKWVFKYAECGPVNYGLRIANLENNYESFQSVVYLKSALVLLMLEDLLGPEELFKRLRFCLEKFKYKSVTSTMLINEISRKEDWLLKFFNGWLFSRKIPEITCQAKLLGKTAELRVSQKDTDFVFPLRVQLETGRGRKTQQVIVLEKDQVFTLSAVTAITSLKVDAGGAPLIIKD